jgi:para-nitrobenzyl esterase
MTRTTSVRFACALVLAGGCGGEESGVDRADATVFAASGDLVRTDTGFIRGLRTENYRLFLGIPYAAPPLGELRWRAPHPVEPWRGVRDATVPGLACAQLDHAGRAVVSAEEDCLSVNVTTPVRHGDRLLPVMVWIHGGGFQAGSNLELNEQRLASEGVVVVVSVNYRLGALGFFGYPGLDGSGTYGLQDQQAALRWVQRNARAFGGDPRNVTIFGVSAGGSSVCAHLASPEAAGLFARAVVQSENCSTRIGSERYIYLTTDPKLDMWKTRSLVEKTGAGVTAALGCSGPQALDCMRRVPVGALLTAVAAGETFVSWTPAYDTSLLPLHPGAALLDGTFNKVPVLAGTTRDEGTIFVSGHDWITPEIWTDGLEQIFGSDGPRVDAAYPLADYVSPRHALAAIIGDGGFACPALEGDRALAAHVPVYVYEFADRDAPLYFEPPAGEVPLGAYHGSDSPYLHGVNTWGLTLEPQQMRLSEQMIRYFARFAAEGHPNSDDLPHWPQFSDDGPQPHHVQSLAPGPSGIAAVDLSAEHHCDLWSSIPDEGREPSIVDP